jgi:hypothetical protein
VLPHSGGTAAVLSLGGEKHAERSCIRASKSATAQPLVERVDHPQGRPAPVRRQAGEMIEVVVLEERVDITYDEAGAGRIPV